MNELGARESRRRRQALPTALDRSSAIGCLGSLTLFIVACLALFAATRWDAVLAAAGFAGLVAAVLVFGELYSLALLVAVQKKWVRHGVRCLVVYSNSPSWADHIRSRWLPRIGEAGIVLNWSDRAAWRSSLSVRVFKRFGGQPGPFSRNFNPVVIVFRGLRQPYAFRFYYAFQQADAGRAQYLEHLEAEMFAALDSARPTAPMTLGRQ